MKAIFAALLSFAVISTATLATAGEADAKVCKAGKILDPDTGKCVTPRGS